MPFAYSVITASVLTAWIAVSPASAQTPANTVVLQPAPDLAGVIKGGTLPEVVVRGLRSADDPLWIPGVGLVFTESHTAAAGT